MAKFLEQLQGGIRLEWTGEGLSVYVDPDKLAKLPIDTPEVRLVTIEKDDIEREGKRFLGNVKDELRRIGKRVERRIKGAKKK